MRNQNVQLYNNTCGIETIKNILQLYNINDEVKINLYRNGIKIKDVRICLEKYFNNVKAVLINLDTLSKTKEPFILLLDCKDNNKHYVCVYKIDRKYIYILDSQYKHSYKVKKEDIKKISSGYGIVVKDIKYEYLKKKKTNIFLVSVISFFETLLMLGLTITLQQLIDNYNINAFYYIVIEILILLISLIKIKLYLKSYKNENSKILNIYLPNIYNLNIDFVNMHDKNELYYRLFDAYTLKSYKLTIIYSLIPDLMMVFFSYILLIYYSYIFALILLCILLVFSLLYCLFLKSISKSLEDKRKSENEFISYFKDSFNKTYITDNKIIEIKAKEYLNILQNDDYILNKKENYKNYILLLFNSLINTSLIVLYFVNLNKYISVGYLIALINLINFSLSYLLNILSYISSFSNIKQIKKRLNDLNKNQNN